MTDISREADVRHAYARDVSGLELVPEGVARPESAGEVVDLLRDAFGTRTPVTAAGCQSSTTAASITDRGILLSLRALNARLDVDASARTVHVDAGVIVADIRRAAASEGLLFAPDPTSEEESTIGGAIACNASGARSLRYGATRPHVCALTVALADGSVHTFRRPALEKNTVGYAMAHDPVDWFIGSEGTLGVVLAAELSLLPLPDHVMGLAIPFATEADALAFVVAARTHAAIAPRCLEYFDARAFAIARAAEGSEDWATHATVLVYTEETGRADSSDRELPLEAWLQLGEYHRALVNDIRVYDADSALREARHMRHAVPATMNERGASFRHAGGRKVSTDWAVPYPRLADTLRVARALADAHGVEQAVTYGHAGNGHPHQNFIARDALELQRIESVVEATLKQVLSVGGTVAAEHGIGKIKRKWLSLQMTDLQQRAMRSLKHELDPYGLMAPGNVL